jgi:hypothetical protein
MTYCCDSLYSSTSQGSRISRIAILHLEHSYPYKNEGPKKLVNLLLALPVNRQNEWPMMGLYLHRWASVGAVVKMAVILD